MLAGALLAAFLPSAALAADKIVIKKEDPGPASAELPSGGRSAGAGIGSRAALVDAQIIQARNELKAFSDEISDAKLDAFAKKSRLQGARLAERFKAALRELRAGKTTIDKLFPAPPAGPAANP